MTYRIALADDHVILRQGLKKILEGGVGFQVVAEADNALDLLRLLRRIPIDLAVLDISMPGVRGIEAIPEVRAIHPQAKILVLTMHRELPFLSAALSAGANGYVLKEDAETQLFAAIAKVRNGATYVSPKLADEMTHDWARPLRAATARVRDGGESLTLRERQILKLTAEGHSSREMSGMLCISARTVEHHRAHIMSKLGLRKTADVVRWALHGGYF